MTAVLFKFLILASFILCADAALRSDDSTQQQKRPMTDTGTDQQLRLCGMRLLKALKAACIPCNKTSDRSRSSAGLQSPAESCCKNSCSMDTLVSHCQCGAK